MGDGKLISEIETASGLVGKELTGWRVEIWYELRVPAEDNSFQQNRIGFFKDKDLVAAESKARKLRGEKANINTVLVLTKDGVWGQIIPGGLVQLSDEESLRAMAVETTRSKLTPEERALLGIK